jgi:hypothetical protein
MNSIEETTSLSYDLFQEAEQEAEKHKWIESQKNGYDVGPHAINHWYDVHWPLYCRSKRLEHLQGICRWDHLGGSDFGLIRHLIESNDLLLDRILDRVLVGYENLDLINWSLDWGLSLDNVLKILSQLDVNRARLDPVQS